MENVVSVLGLNKRYNNFKLSDLSFSIPKGCVAGFIGLNGQGKTTTIKTIPGLTNRDSGKVEFFRKDINEFENEIKDRIGVVFDDGYLYESLKIKEMREIVSKAYSKWDDTKYKELIEKFSLNEKQTIATLSKGMKMKFSLALALSHHAEFLIMDEPTSGLDPLIRRQIPDILKDYMLEEGMGVLYSTHITSDLDKFADIIIFIHEGKILFVKDFLISRKMTIFILVFSWLIPLFIVFMAGGGTRVPTRLLISVISVLLGMMMLSTIYEEEEKNPKARALITTIGYSRKTQVFEKYTVAIILYIYNFFVCFIESFLVSALEPIHITDFAYSTFLFSLFFSVYLTSTIKFGIRASRYIMVFVIMLISIGPSLFSKFKIQMDFSFIKNLGESLLISLLLGLALILYCISLKLSVDVYMKKEL